MKKLISLFLFLIILFSAGCVSSNEKAVVSRGIEEYFTLLKNKEYDSLNKMVFDWDENDGIDSNITENSVNDYIFDKISYNLWKVSKENNIYYVEIIVKQLSLASAYSTTASEFNVYMRKAQLSGKSYSQSALDDAFDKMLYKNLQSESKYLTLKCTVPCKIVDGTLLIGMTADFKNCLFGGELDAINALNDF